MLQQFIWANDRDIVGTTRGDGSIIGKILAATDHRKYNFILKF